MSVTHCRQAASALWSLLGKDLCCTIIMLVIGTACGYQVKLSLTGPIIQQLFREEPHIHAAFQSNVPGKMDATMFWQKYGDFLGRRV